MTEAIQKLIAENRWNPNMDEAPKDGEDVVLLIPGSTTPITIGHCLDGDWFPQDETTLDGNMFIPEPTHFRAMPDDRLAEVCRVLLDFIAGNAAHYEPSDMVPGVSIIQSSRGALARANEIATKGE